MSARADQLRSQILDLVSEYHAETFADRPFVPGETPVPVSGRVFDASDVQSLVDSSLDFWLTTGRFATQFEKAFARYFGVREAVLVNSGSSANLLALTSLTSPRLGDRRLVPGDEVITVAAGFPTTVNPIIQNGLVPVFVDVQVPTYNIDPTRLEPALSDRTRAVMIAHTLGNPFDLTAVKDFVDRHNLYLIEDCCDAVGSTYHGRKVGTFGDLATVSFYPAHHITMGEGGCVLTEKPLLRTLVESFRDWGRDCWCEPGQQNTCGKRFAWQTGELPCGYDHKYTYSHIGYNLKLTDMQAAVGVSQLSKLPAFIDRRKANFHALRQGLRDLEDFFILPEATPGSDPSWFGFPIAIRPGGPLIRNAVIDHLETRKIATRLLFAGNLVRQPAYKDVRFRVAGSLENTDFIMNHVFWVGVYPGITDSMLDYMLESFHSIIRYAKTAEADLAHVIEHTCDTWNTLAGARIFITGGTGFVGKWLLESLLAAGGTSAVVLTRDPQRFEAECPHLANHPAVELLAGRVQDFPYPAGEFPFVIHAATENSFDRNIEGTRHVLEFARTHGVQRFLFTSSGAVYGQQPSDLTHIPEDYPGAPSTTQPSTAYGQSKRFSEFLCATNAAQYGFSALIARLFAFVGPHLPLDRNFAVGNFIGDAMRGGPIRIGGDGTPYRSYLYAADLAVWLWTILVRGNSARPYNVGSDQAISIARVASTVADAIPGRVAIEIARKAIPGAPRLRYVPSVKRACVELGLRPLIPLTEGVRRTYEWLR